MFLSPLTFKSSVSTSGATSNCIPPDYGSIRSMEIIHSLAFLEFLFKIEFAPDFGSICTICRSTYSELMRVDLIDLMRDDVIPVQPGTSAAGF